MASGALYLAIALATQRMPFVASAARAEARATLYPTYLNMTNLLHPLAAHHNPRALDVLYGGNEHDTINESAKLAYDSVKYLPKDQHVLYVNTLCDQRSLDRTMNKFASRRPRLLYMTWLESSFMERIKVLENIIKSKDVGTLVINSFEFAALTQRHRVELGQWLRRIRNLHQIRVVLFMQCKPGYYGVNGSLRFAASNLMEVGSYLKEHSAELTAERIQQEEQIAQDFAVENNTELTTDEAPGVAEVTAPVIQEALSESPSDADQAEEDNEFVDEEETWVSQETDEDLYRLLDSFRGDYDRFPGAQWIIEELEKRGLPIDPEAISAQRLSLKNKELEVVDVV
jgi:hypothetical protein